MIARLLGVFLLLVFAFCWGGCARSFKANPWWALGTAPTLKVVNLLDESCKVVVSTRDGAIRELGVVAAADSVTWKLPFAEQKIAVHVCHATSVLDINGPYVWTLVARRPKVNE